MPHIFISYAKKDTRTLAIQLADALNAIEGLSAWVDGSLRAGQSWELQIQAQIDRCDTMVVLYSPDINRHKQGEDESYVLTEIAYAKYTARKLIIPVMAQRTEPPIALSAAHYIDFTLDGLTLDDLVQALCDELEVTNAPRVTPAPQPKPVTPPPAREPEAKPKPVTPPSPLEGEGLGVRGILPPPFEWIEIPGGEFTMGNNPPRKVTLPTFWIAKYPVTHAQYAKFIDAGGYGQRRWWTDAGWYAKTEGLEWDDSSIAINNNWIPTNRKWIQPEYWSDDKWNTPEQPVNGISWYEAFAFTQWLSEVTDKIVTLPTEAQWEKAARGADARVYPWGDTFDPKRCNTEESNIGKTTPVRQYEGKGDSPYGVVDMAGNVWEWCLDEYDSPQIDPLKVNTQSMSWRALRGGSWSDKHIQARTVYRYNFYPRYLRLNLYGFRLVLNAHG